MAINTNITTDIMTKELDGEETRPGMLHTPYRETMPEFQAAGCEFVYPDLNYASRGRDGNIRKLNCQIVFGRDRPSHLLSGYGKSAGAPCASIDIVAGRMSSANERIGNFVKTIKPFDGLAGSNFYSDASRVYISQKCDIDHYFGLPPGDFGRPEGEAGIGIKSDHVRVIGRESVKIYAGAARGENLGFRGELNSNGKRLTDARIELIADKHNDPQPLVRGGNLVRFLEDLLDKLCELEQSFLLQAKHQMKLQTILAGHGHVGGGAGVVVVGPSGILAKASLKKVTKDLQLAANSMANSFNYKIMKLNYLGIPNHENAKYRLKTKKHILSSNVFTT